MEFVHETVDLGYEDLVADTRKSGRTYSTPDGTRYPSITTVLSILSEEAIAAWRKRVGEETANRIGHQASGRGTQVHAIVEKYLKNEEIDGYLPHVRQSLENLRPILDSRIGTIYGLEVPLYSTHLGVAGRCDCIAEFDGVRSIVDFKTSKRVKTKDKISNYFAQMAGYAVMWEERTGMPIDRIRIVMDVDDFHPVMYIEKRDDWIDQFIYWRDEYNKRIMFQG